MSDRSKLFAYLAGLVVIFALAFAVGNLTQADPDPAPQPEHGAH